jgi:hypothetical protein
MVHGANNIYIEIIPPGIWTSLMFLIPESFQKNLPENKIIKFLVA